MTCGHGGSKSQWPFAYIGQTYARLGVACLVLDPIGEEERHITGGLGTRAHDPEPVHNCSDHAGRLIMGKLVFDTIRGIDFLMTRPDIDPDRIGVAGNSLEGQSNLDACTRQSPKTRIGLWMGIQRPPDRSRQVLHTKP
jgi:cephalosporin-C deacetylase-like acetyl esterase